MSSNTKNKFGGGALQNSLRYRDSLTENGKICTKCGEDKPFNKYTKQKGNYKSWCKDCISEYAREKYKKRSYKLW